jgi:hypothetical protein
MSGNEKIERELESFLKEDDSRLAMLYRKLPRPEPDAKLDAAVLAMAQRTVTLSTRTSRPRWLPVLGAAAGLVLAAGVALRVGPQIWGERSEPTPAAMRDNGVIQVRPVDEAAPPPPPSEPALAAPASSASMQAARALKPKPAPVPAREAPAEAAQQPAAASALEISADRADVDAKELKKVENAAPRVAAPQAFPGQPQREGEMNAVERKQAIAAGAWQKLHENEPAARAKTAPAPAANAATTAAQPESTGAPPDQEKRSEVRQPTYSADLIRNSHLYPESWIAAIQRLIRDGRRDEALQNLDLFRKKYPSYHLPADLERLLAPPR